MKSGKQRRYVMRARADAAAATRGAILESACDLFFCNAFEDVTIDRIATRAGTAVRTVLRVFGSKDALFVEALRTIGRLREASVDPKDPEAFVADTHAFYERMGDTIIRWLADEPRIPPMHDFLETGRRALRSQVGQAFAGHLARFPERERKEVHDALIVSVDAYTWKLLRRDFGLSKRAALSTTLRLVRGILKGEPDG
ncbi:MAG TPA: helix-turn-helix domain-containing protein [Burkholderiaceae bacterium]|nr:helix-turn-helix domain-containing protein [Burkholderiaceae bacterium]